jgi:hypothetical protein
MPGMFGMRGIFEFIVDCFDHRTLPQQYLVPHAHQLILHVISYSGHQMDPVVKQECK